MYNQRGACIAGVRTLGATSPFDGDKQATALGEYFRYFIIFDGLRYCYSLGQLHMTSYYILGLSTDYSDAPRRSALFRAFYLVFIPLFLISDLPLQHWTRYASPTI